MVLYCEGMETVTLNTMSNPRAEANFVASGLSDSLRPAVKAEAHYIMSMVGMRYSDAVHTACQYAARGSFASPCAQAIFANLT